jgi:hypothetical protein
LGYDQKKGIWLKSLDALNYRLFHQLRPPPNPKGQITDLLFLR